jgi:hypothetical protein
MKIGRNNLALEITNTVLFLNSVCKYIHRRRNDVSGGSNTTSTQRGVIEVRRVIGILNLYDIHSIR